MKKYQKVAMNIAFLTIIFSAGLLGSHGVALASDLNLNFSLNDKITANCSKEQREKILNTFESANYKAWKRLVGQNHKINNIVDEATFKNFIAARKAARNGQYNKALKITEELKEKVEKKLS